MTWRKLTGILLSAVCLIALAAGFLNVRNADEPNKGAIIDKSVLNKSETTQNTTPLPSKMCEDMIRLLTESELEPDMIEGKQLIIVNAYGTQAELYCFEMDSENSWEMVSGPINAHVGRGGVSADKIEGDLKTPTGLYRIGFAFGTAEKIQTDIPYKAITPDSYWVDDSDSKYYNSWVDAADDIDWKSAERLCSYQKQYEFAAVIEYNVNPTVPGKGSAIFLHCGETPTAGCVTISRNEMIQVLSWLDDSLKPMILITGK